MGIVSAWHCNQANKVVPCQRFSHMYICPIPVFSNPFSNAAIVRNCSSRAGRPEHARVWKSRYGRCPNVWLLCDAIVRLEIGTHMSGMLSAFASATARAVSQSMNSAYAPCRDQHIQNAGFSYMSSCFGRIIVPGGVGVWRKLFAICFELEEHT